MTRRTDRPGYVSNGSGARYWNPRRAVKGAPATIPLKRFDAELTDDAVGALCRQYTDELRADLDVKGRGRQFDGTIGSLIALYRTDPESPYQALKHSTRIRDYEPSLALIVDTIGNRAIHVLVGSDFRRWFKQWGSKGRKRRAHGAIRKLRAALSWGLTEDLAGCAKARAILAEMEFVAPEPRRVKMEYEHAKAICEKAIETGAPLDCADAGHPMGHGAAPDTHHRGMAACRHRRARQLRSWPYRLAWAYRTRCLASGRLYRAHHVKEQDGDRTRPDEVPARSMGAETDPAARHRPADRVRGHRPALP
jgi:hypothetical protein